MDERSLDRERPPRILVQAGRSAAPGLADRRPMRSPVAAPLLPVNPVFPQR
jgi:hypothetical protein